MAFKITYSVLDADLTELHKLFDSALNKIKSNLGIEFPYWVGGKPYKSGELLEDRNPSNTGELLSLFHKTPVNEIEKVINEAKKAQSSWGKYSNWKRRAEILKKAADLLSERRMEIASIMALEAGKNRMESLGDVEEGADLLRYYATQLEEANGFLKPMAKLSKNENAKSILRPYGLFLVIAPFNFPLALVAGMSSGALSGGNSIIIKPSRETPWTAQKFYECLRDAGMPDGVVNLIYGTGAEIGDLLIKNRAIDGIVFTGSYYVGMRILREFSSEYPKPCILEMGGKNAAIICQSANLEKAISGCYRSSFGLTGQKCSALSRIYVHKSIKEKFISLLVEKTKTMVIGDPTDKEVFMGPLINEKGVKIHLQAIKEAKKSGKIHCGGNDLRKNPKFSKGFFVEPTIAEVPRGHRLFKNELFCPFIVIDTFENIEEAVKEASNVIYGLTGGIFSENKNEIEYFFEHMEAGVLYANRSTGATTGAWPGVQPFCGWKGSGSTGKGGCGPHYVAQFMREQSQTLME